MKAFLSLSGQTLLLLRLRTGGLCQVVPEVLKFLIGELRKWSGLLLGSLQRDCAGKVNFKRKSGRPTRKIQVAKRPEAL